MTVSFQGDPNPPSESMDDLKSAVVTQQLKNLLSRLDEVEAVDKLEKIGEELLTSYGAETSRDMMEVNGEPVEVVSIMVAGDPSVGIPHDELSDASGNVMLFESERVARVWAAGNIAKIKEWLEL